MLELDQDLNKRWNGTMAPSSWTFRSRGCGVHVNDFSLFGRLVAIVGA